MKTNNCVCCGEEARFWYGSVLRKLSKPYSRHDNKDQVIKYIDGEIKAYERISAGFCEDCYGDHLVEFLDENCSFGEWLEHMG